MTDKQDWPIHARAAWEHEKKRGDRLYRALCDMEAERDALRQALREVVAQLVWCENPQADDLESVRYALRIARAALAPFEMKGDPTP